MIKEKDLIQRLNLLRSSNSFVFHETGNLGDAEVIRICKVPPSSGIYWIAGETLLKNGINVKSVFRVDTDSGGSLVDVYWWIEGNWYDQNDLDVFKALGTSRSEVFPYDWKYHVPLSIDIYHD